MTQIELNSKQHRWIELLKDYDISNLYHSGKVNILENALSQKVVIMDNLPCISVSKRPLAWNI